MPGLGVVWATISSLRINPRFAMAFYNRGLVWAIKKDHDKAITDFTEVIRLDPKNVLCYNNRGFAWSNKKGNRSRANRRFSQRF